MWLQQDDTLLNRLTGHLRRHESGGIQEALCVARPGEAARALGAFDFWHQALFLELVPAKTAASIFRALPLRQQAGILLKMGPRTSAWMLEQLDPDERGLALSLLDGVKAGEIKGYLSDRTPTS